MLMTPDQGSSCDNTATKRLKTRIDHQMRSDDVFVFAGRFDDGLTCQGMNSPHMQRWRAAALMVGLPQAMSIVLWGDAPATQCRRPEQQKQQWPLALAVCGQLLDLQNGHDYGS